LVKKRERKMESARQENDHTIGDSVNLKLIIFLDHDLKSSLEGGGPRSGGGCEYLKTRKLFRELLY